MARVTVVGPFAQLALPWAAMSRAERGNREGALEAATRARLAFPPTSQFTGLCDGCELWCMALLDHPDWSLRFQECEHFVPVAGSPHFTGRRWFAFFLVLAHMARGELEAAAALYRVLRQALDDGWRIGPLQPVEGLAGLAAAAGNGDVAEATFARRWRSSTRSGTGSGNPRSQSGTPGCSFAAPAPAIAIRRV